MSRGFVLPAVLVLLGLAAALVAQALMDATTSAAVAMRLQLRQRAFEAAQAALDGAETALAQGRAPVATASTGDGGSRARLTLRLDRRELLPEGFSAGRFAVEHLRASAQASGPRGTRLELSTGYARWVAAP